MISAHGSDELTPLYVFDESHRLQLKEEANHLPNVLLNSAAACNVVMLGAGYFTPLSGFMNVKDAISVAESMHTSSGLFWPVPILNLVHDASMIKPGASIALKDPNVSGHPVIAIQKVEAVEELSKEQVSSIIRNIYRTTDPKHPGVSTFSSLGNMVISGPIQALSYSYFQDEFPGTFRTAVEIRNEISGRGWQTVVGFQTRNPMHRAHEELCKMAQHSTGADGILIHMLLGKLKPGDIPAPVRDDAIRKMVELYFPPNSVMITGYGFDMLYAGPREAVLHAVFRQNCGCTHFIVGRDHAGVGDYYGAFDSQKIFKEEIPPGTLDINIFEADHTAYSKVLNKIVMMRDAPDHKKEDFVILSGTKVRAMLAAGEALPKEFARPEVAKILMDYYQSL